MPAPAPPDTLLRHAAVKPGPAVGVHVAERADALVQGVAEPAGGGEEGDAVPRPARAGRARGPGERVPERVDDHRAGDPADAALGPVAVARGDEHPVDARAGLDPGDL